MKLPSKYGSAKNEVRSGLLEVPEGVGGLKNNPIGYEPVG
jgi:hypothetical protein